MNPFKRGDWVIPTGRLLREHLENKPYYVKSVNNVFVRIADDGYHYNLLKKVKLVPNTSIFKKLYPEAKEEKNYLIIF